jgi:hypothetical protein
MDKRKQQSNADDVAVSVADSLASIAESLERVAVVLERVAGETHADVRGRTYSFVRVLDISNM